MLAQNFKSATDLGISEPQFDALRKTLALLETGKLVHKQVDSFSLGAVGDKFTGHFNMETWGRESSCGTIACIGGTAEMVGHIRFDLESVCGALSDLFEPRAINWRHWHDITASQAARALRSYLTTGDAKWHEAVS